MGYDSLVLWLMALYPRYPRYPDDAHAGTYLGVGGIEIGHIKVYCSIGLLVDLL